MITLDAQLIKYTRDRSMASQHGYILAEPHAYPAVDWLSTKRPRVFVVERRELLNADLLNDGTEYTRPYGPGVSIFSSYNDAYDYARQQGWTLILESASDHG